MTSRTKIRFGYIARNCDRSIIFFQAKDGARANKGPRAERVLTIRYRYFATLYRGHAR